MGCLGSRSSVLEMIRIDVSLRAVQLLVYSVMAGLIKSLTLLLFVLLRSVAILC